ncbi:hypothetical protein XAB3213_3220003 [Xanthomonas citri pv. bilvae]|nr:hypothetical protein XAB3213_3220003 [Xanthomonas citri pv. bilvae]
MPCGWPRSETRAPVLDAGVRGGLRHASHHWKDGIDALYAASHARPLHDWLAARTRSLQPHDGLASCYIGSQHHRARPQAEAGCVRTVEAIAAPDQRPPRSRRLCRLRRCAALNRCPCVRNSPRICRWACAVRRANSVAAAAWSRFHSAGLVGVGKLERFAGMAAGGCERPRHDTAGP